MRGVLLVALAVSAACDSGTGGPADLIPYVGPPVFDARERGFSARITVKSKTRSNISIRAVSSNGVTVEADCPDTRAKFINDALVFDAPVLSCLGNFKVSLLGYWSNKTISFTWDAAQITLEPTFGIPATLKFNPDATRRPDTGYDLLGFLV